MVTIMISLFDCEENLKYEDTPFVAKALDCANKIGKIDKCLNHYIVHEQSETTIRDRRCFDILKIVDILRTYFKDKEYIKEELDKWTVRTITNYTIQQRMQKNKKIGMKFIDEAFSYLKKEVPDYKNNRANLAIKTIKDIYEQCIEHKGFLTYHSKIK